MVSQSNVSVPDHLTWAGEVHLRQSSSHVRINALQVVFAPAHQLIDHEIGYAFAELRHGHKNAIELRVNTFGQRPWQIQLLVL